MEDKILKKAEEVASDMINDIIEIVKINSIKTESIDNMPFGEGISKALHKALEISQKLGFETKNIDEYIGYAQYGKNTDDKYVCAIGHVDVVDVGDGWKNPPFSGWTENNIIYSRGILDNKGPIMTCLYALYVLKELNINFKYNTRIIFGCDEESGFSDLEYYLKKEKPPIMGFTPDCKYPVVYGERGRAVIKIYSPIEKIQTFFDFVNNYFIGAKNNGDRLGIDYFDKEFGMMEMRNYNLSIENSEVAFHVTISYPAGITIESIFEKICKKLENLNGINAIIEKNYNPVKFNKDNFMVQALKESYEKVTGFDGTPVTTTGGTYAKAMPNIVPFGPSFPGQKGIGHNPNEWMKIDDLITNLKIYALSLYKLSCK